MHAFEVVVHEFVVYVRQWSLRWVESVEVRNFRVVLEIVEGRDGGIGVFIHGHGTVVGEIPLESVEPGHLRVPAHETKCLHLFIAVEILFGVVDSSQGVAGSGLGISTPLGIRKLTKIDG